jgi:dodecin
MTEHVYKTVELTGSSTEGLQQAITNAIQRAAKTVHHMRWFEITNMRGEIEDGGVRYWQVTVKVSFNVE